MKGFFRSNTFKVMVILVVLLAALIAVSGATNNTVIQSVLSFFTSPMQETLSSAQSQYADYSKEELLELYEQAIVENAELREQLVDYYEIKQTNDEYEQALNIEEQNSQLDLMVALVIGKDPLDVFHGFTVNSGYIDGVEIGDPVITAQGMVGVVTEIYATSAYVTTIFSEEISIGAISKEFSETGVVEGDMLLMDEGMVRLSYLTNTTKIQAGTIITTSGTTGLFPADIIIGRVVYLENSAEDASVYAAVEPYEDIKNLSAVYIVTDFSGKTDIVQNDEDISDESGE